MTAFQFRPVTPHPLLSPYIAKIYVFESSGRLPDQDKKLIVPNANLKLTLTCRNGISACVAGKSFIQSESRLSLTGLIDVPVMLNPQEDKQTGTIVIEFNPLGAYRLFHLSYTEVKNQIMEMADLVGRSASALQLQLAEAGTIDHTKVLRPMLNVTKTAHPAGRIGSTPACFPISLRERAFSERPLSRHYVVATKVYSNK